jgi:uncharacterized membrane protein YbaN (DUF454 family)
MPKTIAQYIYFTSGLISLLLGLIGVVLPLLPTTPFILLSAFCFSRSSERFHQKLLNHKRLGPMITDWEENGVISLPAKIFSTLAMYGLASYPLLFVLQNNIIRMCIFACMLCVSAFIWSRPSKAKT